MEAWKNLTGVILESYFAESKHSLAIFFMVVALLLKIKHMLSGSLFTSFFGGWVGVASFLKVVLTTLEDNFPFEKGRGKTGRGNSLSFQRGWAGATSTPECARGVFTYHLGQSAARPARSPRRPSGPELVRGRCPWC